MDRAEMPIFEIAVHPHLETRNLLVWCGSNDFAQASTSGAPERNCTTLWRRLARDWEAFRQRFAAAVKAAQKPVYMIGGSHSQYNLANYAGIGGLVGHLIDDDPEKLGRIPPILGSGPSIISTAQFEASARGGTVLKTAFGYPTWTARVCAHAASLGMRIIDPHDFIEHHE